MNFYRVACIVNLIALCAIYVSPINQTPLYGVPSYRIGGIFVPKHLIIVAASGILIGSLSDIRPLHWAIVYGTVFQFALGQIIHLALGTKTMLLYKLGLAEKPDGTGRLAVPVLKQ